MGVRGVDQYVISHLIILRGFHTFSEYITSLSHLIVREG